MSDAPPEKTPAEIEMEDTLRSIRGFRENADAAESPDESAPSQSDDTEA
jgi:hypothetical protein